MANGNSNNQYVGNQYSGNQMPNTFDPLIQQQNPSYTSPYGPNYSQQGGGFWNTMGDYGGAAMGALGGVSEIVKPLAQLGGLAYSIYNMVQGPPEPRSIDNFESWASSMPDRMQLMEQIMPMPYMEGTRVPEYGDVSFGGTEPSDATKAIYEQFLGREYGLSPDELDQRRQLILSSIMPTERTLGPTPASTLRQEQQMPEQMVNVLSQLQKTSLQDQQSYLKNAATVAAYNASRARNLAGIIG